MKVLKRVPLHVGDMIALAGVALALTFGFGWAAAVAYYWSFGCIPFS